ncbi:MAG: immunoglobulin domain-containing protein, partial [Verrucomicrobia bacterium]|nr:immunoglobulin domain-containing protein [Verrucomicrobiota bacterium]
SPVSGRYVRWEVLAGPAAGNLGGNQMYFLNSPPGATLLPAPTVINSATPYNAGYAASHAVDGYAGTGNNDGSYASQGLGAGMFVDFDFGVPTVIAGWEFLNRPVDVVTAYQMIFSDVSDFSTGSTTNSYTASANGMAWNTVTLSPITARYVRLQATASIVSPNTGIREIQFYGSPNAVIMRPPQNATNYVWGVQTLTVTAGGAEPLAYQWYRVGTPATIIPGATSATYTIDPVANASAGGYFVVVSNNLNSATSAVATLTVLDPTPDYTSALAAYYSFDETNGTVAADSSGNGINATLFNFPTDDSMWVPGRVGGAIQFNALDTTVDNQVVTDSELTLQNEDYFTFAFWAKRRSDNNPYNPRIIGPVSPVDGQYWVLWSPANHGVGFYPPAPSPEPIRDVWQHFVVTYDRPAGTYQTYVDGRLKATATSPNYLKTTPAGRQWAIGCKEVLSATSDPWHGYLDDVRVYNRILLPGDVKALFEVAGSVAPTFATQPVGADLFSGDTLRLRAAVDGTPPITYQWYRNRTNLFAGATDLNLVIPNVTTSDAGDYTIVAINALKPATSAVARVTVALVTSVTNGLAGYWKFDESTGTTAADSSGRGNAGTVANSLLDGGHWAAGKVGGALTFRGPGLGDDYVVVP